MLTVAAIGTTISSLIGLVSLTLLAYVLLDLARMFIAGTPEWVRTVHKALGRVWEPVLRRVREVLPPMGGLDFSPLVILLLLQVVAAVIR